MRVRLVAASFVVALCAVVVPGCRPDVCDRDAAPSTARPLPVPAAGGAHVFGHAHNDYEHAHPLTDALEARFYSVEADVWLDAGTVKVSHGGAPFVGTLQTLYLDPLQARVDTTGSVHGDGAPFTLWIDIKDGSPALQDALADLLGRYAMFTRFSDDAALDRRAVTAQLTGDAGAKRALVERASPRPYARDDNSFHLDDAHADARFVSYALPWSDYVSWNGTGAIAADERQRLVCVVDRAHERGRTVRMFATPETRAYWQLALDTGVDFINTDDLAGLSAFLDGASAR